MMSGEIAQDLAIDDVDWIRGQTEALLVDDLARRGLLLPHYAFATERWNSRLEPWNIDLGDDRDFLVGLYRQVLGRWPSEGEVRLRLQQLAQPGVGRRQVSQEVCISPEAVDRKHAQAKQFTTARIYEVYEEWFRKKADKAVRIPIVSANGTSFLLQNIVEITDPFLLIAIAYRDLLGRVGVLSELLPWVNSLLGVGGSEVVCLRGIAESAECRARLPHLDISQLDSLQATGWCKRSDNSLIIGILSNEVEYLRKFGSTLSQVVFAQHEGERVARQTLPTNSGEGSKLGHQGSASGNIDVAGDVTDLREKVLTEIDRRYRGTEDSLRKQMLFYREHLASVKDLGPMLDIGCGRGIMMDIMAEIGATAEGIDLSETQVNVCREKGLNVSVADAYEFLRETATDSYSAITMLHIIEHLTFDAQLRILREIHRVLVPEGIVLIETPNPENLFISLTMFYTDPTHIRPVTYNFLSTMMSVIGFETERLNLFMPFLNDGNQTKNVYLNHTLNSSGNLSVFGRKSA